MSIRDIFRHNIRYQMINNKPARINCRWIFRKLFSMILKSWMMHIPVGSSTRILASLQGKNRRYYWKLVGSKKISIRTNHKTSYKHSLTVSGNRNTFSLKICKNEKNWDGRWINWPLDETKCWSMLLFRKLKVTCIQLVLFWVTN